VDVARREDVGKGSGRVVQVALGVERTWKTGLRWAREALRARGIGTLSARNRMQPRPVSYVTGEGAKAEMA
jgi:hypothetical protein